MKKIVPIIIIVLIAIIVIVKLTKSDDLNSLGDRNFTKEGKLKKKPDFAKINDTVSVRFFIESSGSMNGFFRSDAPTEFKRDVYTIMSYYTNITKDINIMTNEGSIDRTLTLSQFQGAMNAGNLQSNASTKVPKMLTSIIEQLHKGEVAVLISDMKYSPVGDQSPEVLLLQYSAEIAKIAGNSKNAFGLVGATSDYLMRTQDTIKKSPYYYLIIGDQDRVTYIRNGISSILDRNNNYVDNIDFGYEYGNVPYEFGNIQNVVQLENEPTFCEYLDPCTITLKVKLETYRWIVANEKIIRNNFKCKSMHGSTVKTTIKDIEVDNYTDKELKRSVVATIELKVSNMQQDMDVIEWNLDIPSSDYTRLTQFYGATSENDFTKSYSIETFISGIQQGGIVNKQPNPNYILITKKNL